MADETKPEELLKLQFAKKIYVFNMAKRFANKKAYGVLKRPMEVKENPYFRQIRLTIYRLIGRKEEA